MPLIHDKRVTDTGSYFRVIFSFLTRFDWIPLLPMLGLLTFGVLFVYGTGQQVGGVNTEFWQSHLLWIGVGFALWLFFSLMDYRYLGPLSLIFYPTGIFLLIYVLLFGVRRFSARRWLDVFGTSFQPAEFAKVSTVIFCAWLITRPSFDVRRWLTPLILLPVIGIPCFLIFRQPNLSTALTIVISCGAIVFVDGFPWKRILLALLILAVAVPCVYPFLKPYHKGRITVFLNPGKDVQNKGWNQRQAELAVGSGGVTGKGFMQGTQNQLGYLPRTVSNSDFIFSVIAEETGFLGSALLLVFYILLIFSVLRTAMLTNDRFGRNLCIGIAAVMAVHTIVNIGMSIRLTPVTGIPLPLVSYGGTFMVATLSYLGIVQSVYANRNRNVLPEETV